MIQSVVGWQTLTRINYNSPPTLFYTHEAKWGWKETTYTDWSYEISLPTSSESLVEHRQLSMSPSFLGLRLTSFHFRLNPCLTYLMPLPPILWENRSSQKRFSTYSSHCIYHVLCFDSCLNAWIVCAPAKTSLCVLDLTL